MVQSLVLVLAFTIFGDIAAERTGLPVPGAALGMLALAAWLTARGGADVNLASLFDRVSPHFTLFFIPAAVGVVDQTDLLATAWLYVLAAVVLGTSVTIAVTGLLAQRLIQAAPARSLTL